ncbi:hypothetical protein PM082_020710 [Marasmius tenuissimus]|nr:hypothetical protein PM082_020710 [Marasmius tenuissimus]
MDTSNQRICTIETSEDSALRHGLRINQLVQLLLPGSNDDPPPPLFPEIPQTDQVCLFISIISVAPWVEAFLCLGLAFDGIAFLAIAYFNFSLA